MIRRDGAQTTGAGSDGTEQSSMINCDHRRRKRGKQALMTAEGRCEMGWWHGWVTLCFRTRAREKAVPQVQVQGRERGGQALSKGAGVEREVRVMEECIETLGSVYQRSGMRQGVLREDIREY